MIDKIEARLRKLEKINLQLMAENFEISRKLDDLSKQIKELKQNEWT